MIVVYERGLHLFFLIGIANVNHYLRLGLTKDSFHNVYQLCGSFRTVTKYEKFEIKLHICENLGTAYEFSLAN